MKPASEFANAHVIKIGHEGTLTLSMPEMAGRMLIVEQRGGQLVISPFDVDWQAGPGLIARREGRWTLLGTPSDQIPRV